jgi:hypothetical protein
MSAQIPVSAEVEQQFQATHDGDNLRIALYKGKASDGYKSDFRRRDARWLVWERTTAQGERVFYHAARFGGKRFVMAPGEYRSCVAQLRAAGVVERGNDVPSQG